jgi:hypothetical protein
MYTKVLLSGSFLGIISLIVSIVVAISLGNIQEAPVWLCTWFYINISYITVCILNFLAIFLIKNEI